MSKEWDEVCSLTIDGNDCKEGVFTLEDGRKFGILHTAYGDGTYPSSTGHDIGVDSGTIGCIRTEDIRVVEDGYLELGNIVEMKYEFTPYAKDGVLYFGDVVVNTDDYEDEFDEDYSDKWDEEEYNEDDWVNDEDDD
jgi:hypothetical protein